MIIRSKQGKIFEEMTQNHGMVFPCGGGGICGKCKVKVLSQTPIEISPADKLVFTPYELEQGYRLACHIQGEEEIDVRFDAQMAEDEKEKAIILKEGHLAPFVLDPVLHLIENRIYFDQYQIYASEISNSLLALIVDIGSTTLVVSLIDVETGHEIGSRTGLNPQRQYGQDVMTRITAIQRDPEKLHEMSQMVIQLVQNLGVQLCHENGYEPTAIYGIYIAANAVMNHILLEASPVSLGLAPYQLQFKSKQVRKFESLGITQFGEGYLMTLPNISAFVGGDIVAGIIATALYRYQGTALLVDIGTNGEIVLMHNQQLYSTSCAAGPALEGMNIACGTTAQSGAIEEAKIVRGTLRYTTINKEKAMGICGSGILALVREFLKVGLITPRGNVAKLDQVEGKLQRYLDPDHKRIWVDKKRDLYLTQKDIRQIQLAKGAILSGIQCLLNASELSEEKIDQVFIAGQFGSYVNPDSLVDVGLIPQGLKHVIDYVGNTSKTGCQMMALNRAFYQQADQLVKDIRHIELSLLDNYDRVFAKATIFPQRKEDDNDGQTD